MRLGVSVDNSGLMLSASVVAEPLVDNYGLLPRIKKGQCVGKTIPYHETVMKPL